jgi:hypothetical protein
VRTNGATAEPRVRIATPRNIHSFLTNEIGGGPGTGCASTPGPTLRPGGAREALMRVFAIDHGAGVSGSSAALTFVVG